MAQCAAATGLWGDQGNGFYRNPVLFGDFSDPDVCRVGADYYMVCSEFHFMGMPVLHSADLVNWEWIGRIYDRLPGAAYDCMERYGRGAWAPSIRFHHGLFYVYFCTPDEGLFLARSRDPAGTWNLTQVADAAGWEDPCPYWAPDGSAWLGHSVLGAGPILLHRMSPDGTRLLDDGQEIYRGPGAEGTKFYAMESGVLLLLPEGGTSMGWETAARASSVEGPYTARRVLAQGDTWINGPHQGALVDTPAGEWWFLHFSSCGVAGRLVCLEPVTFRDGWPVIGEPITGGDGSIGQPVTFFRKPALPPQPIAAPAASDDFRSPCLALPWQWNHNPVAAAWSLTERPGWLRLRRISPADDLLRVRGMLTQRLLGASGVIRVRLAGEGMTVGQCAGLALLGEDPCWFGLSRTADGFRIAVGLHGLPGEPASEQLPPGDVELEISIQQLTEIHFAYRTGSEPFTFLRCDGHLSEGIWKGARIGLFTCGGSPGDGAGAADFTAFQYRHDGPQDC